MFNRTVQRSRGESPVTIASPAKPKPPEGRARLKNYVEQIEKGQHAVAEITEHIARLQAVVIESETASRALQDSIANDHGAALALYSSGQANDHPIARLVTHAQQSSDAAAAAKVAIPYTETLLAEAKRQLVSLDEQRNEELNRVMASLADQDAQAYSKAFYETARLHDKLAGYANVAQSNVGDILLISGEPLKVPRFALPSLGDSLADPFVRAASNHHAVEQSARQWTEIRARLERDPEANVNDLLISRERRS
jgi:hypothetical protein